jgi:nitrate reductase gamma subunit
MTVDAIDGGPRRPRFSWLAPSSYVPTFAGLIVAAIGFALLVITWAQVAGEDNVAFQLPYVVSGGLTGLGLIMGGFILVNISAKRQDAAERSRQMDQLRESLDDLRSALRELDDKS